MKISLYVYLRFMSYKHTNYKTVELANIMLELSNLLQIHMTFHAHAKTKLIM